MFVGIKNAIKRIYCSLFGHKLLEESVMAYNINTKYIYTVVRIYKVSKCARCGEIVCKEIDWYDKLGWYAPYLAVEEGKALRKRGIISIAEAYQEIKNKEIDKEPKKYE